MKINIEFRDKTQEDFFWTRARNNCFSGGFGNGKSYAGCLRQFVMLTTFPKYRTLIARQKLTDLRETTQKTFFKICPPELIKRQDNQQNTTELVNGSMILWKHLDAFDEQSLRGLEINSALLDQAEEIEEGIYLILDSRIGRWDQAQVPSEFLEANPYWPKDNFDRPRVPNFIDILCNPDTTFHWIYRRFHPDSLERQHDHFYTEAPTNPELNDPNTIAQILTRDQEWVDKYYYGKWGASGSQIHILNSASILEPSEELLRTIKNEAALYRILDHGDACPTCCLWAAALRLKNSPNPIYIFFREYYSSNEVISSHRRNIFSLSEDESYSGNYADPSIFHKKSQKDGGFWAVSDEYLTSDIDAPILAWSPADNNEYATRNRINELLKPSFKFKHPITGATPAPGIYFINRTKEYPTGCYNAISQISAQRRCLIGSDNGKVIYSDDRERSVPDHAYDCIRYFIAMHGGGLAEKQRSMPKKSFAYYNYMMNRKIEPTPLGRTLR